MSDQGCSRGGDSGSAVIPLLGVPVVLRPFFYGNTVAESSQGFVNQWNMLQTLHPATPFPSTLGHNSPLSSCKDARILFLGPRGNVPAPEKRPQQPGAARQVKI